MVKSCVYKSGIAVWVNAAASICVPHHARRSAILLLFRMEYLVRQTLVSTAPLCHIDVRQRALRHQRQIQDSAVFQLAGRAEWPARSAAGRQPLGPHYSCAWFQWHAWLQQSLDANSHRPELGNNNGAARRERAGPAQVPIFAQRGLNACSNQCLTTATFDHSQVRVRREVNTSI